MKKLISLLLVLLLFISIVAPSASAIEMNDIRSKTPIVCISGDGGALVDKDGNQLSKLTKFFTNNGNSTESGDDQMSNILSSVANVIFPLIYNGIINNDFDPYYDALQSELSELFGDMVLDENGEASNGSGVDPWGIEQNEFDMTWDRKWGKDFYLPEDYHFWYDWRLDPITLADQFNDYIQGVKNITGAPKVAILSRCLGTNVVCAYIQKYGLDDICGIGFDGAVCMGAEPISESISGNFNIDGNALKRVLIDGNFLNLFNIDPLIIATIDLAEKSGIFDTAIGISKETFYKTLVEGVTSAVTLAAISYPGYWACVKPEDFDSALYYVFGEEGSEKRIKYAGLIEKITRYNDEIKVNIPDILMSIKENNVNVGVIAKYGLQLLPICKSRNEIADTFVSINSASFGATTGNIYKTLPEKYLEDLTNRGLDSYVSPDNLIDASTCIFPDYTWFIKGVKHSEWTEAENNLLATVITADRQLTIKDFPETQFMVRNPENPQHMIAMTKDNCHTENWDANDNEDNPTNIIDFFISFIKSFISWIRLVFNVVFSNVGTN